MGTFLHCDFPSGGGGCGAGCPLPSASGRQRDWPHPSRPRCVSICSLAFSMDGMFLSASSNTETVHIFKLETVKEK